MYFFKRDLSKLKEEQERLRRRQAELERMRRAAEEKKAQAEREEEERRRQEKAEAERVERRTSSRRLEQERAEAERRRLEQQEQLQHEFKHLIVVLKIVKHLKNVNESKFLFNFLLKKKIHLTNFFSIMNNNSRKSSTKSHKTIQIERKFNDDDELSDGFVFVFGYSHLFKIKHLHVVMYCR